MAGFMADEIVEDINNKDRSEDRFKKLTEKVGEAEKKAQDALKEKAEIETAKATVEKERDFFSSFADATGNYPEAKNYKDAIKEKVMSGYTVEDATVSILAKEGKLNNYTPPARTESPAGGSATNQLKSDSYKTLGEMTKAEKRAELQKMEDEGGSVSQIFRRNII